MVLLWTDDGAGYWTINILAFVLVQQVRWWPWTATWPVIL